MNDEHARLVQRLELPEHFGKKRNMLVYNSARSDMNDAAQAIRALSADLEGTIELLSALTDEDPCQYDHHGHCQTHGWLYAEPECPVKRANILLNRDKDNG